MKSLSTLLIMSLLVIFSSCHSDHGAKDAMAKGKDAMAAKGKEAMAQGKEAMMKKAEEAKMKGKEAMAEGKEAMMGKKDMMSKAKTVAFTQVGGEFMQKEMTLKAGTYVFEVSNKNVGHEVGFVLAPKGKTDKANHIKAAYVKAPVKMGSMSQTNEITLEKGEYVYFCPLNPTPEYTLVVN